MGNEQTAVVEAKNVEKVYNQDEPGKEAVRAVDDASFTVNENEFVAIVGPSGCGKTTLLRIVAGLTPTTSGEVLCNGNPVTGPSINRAVVFQRFNLFPWRTVKENVAFGPEMIGESKAEYERLAEEYIELVGLDGFQDSYPSELSGGMQQRVGLARALVVDPDILLMDEPFGALDAQTRQLMQRELLEIWEENRKTILFITHDIDEAILLADRIFVMGINPRRIVEQIDVPFDRPRYDNEIEGNETFAELKQEIWELLQQSHTEKEMW
jgi:NitT/TauT family transport system ATP-binding protein